jgi:hypothetical protein
MPNESAPNLFTPEHTFKRMVWRSILGFSGTLAQLTNWTITGVAAIAGLVISNLDSVSATVTQFGLKWGLLLFALALISGVLSKQYGMAVAVGLETISKMEAMMFSPEGRQLLSGMSTPPKKMMDELAEPFWWPISIYMKAAGVSGTKDYLAADKRMINLFCVQLFFAAMHSIFATAALVVIAVSIK